MNLISKILNKNKQFEFVANDDGLHQLGGNIPPDFSLPQNEFLGGFQYLGFIDNNDSHFAWLPFPLHLTCPIFTDFDYIFLDYSIPLNPKIIYPTNTALITSAFDEITRDSRIIYNSLKFSLQAFDGINEDNEFDVVAIAGKPHWEQSPDLPVCPKSNKKMQFVAQLMSNAPITAKEKNFKSDSKYYEDLFNNLNFWCDGSLKVFFEPKSKVACYFIQNT